jgi:tetratricopeptide (TPR) repeat protein
MKRSKKNKSHLIFSFSFIFQRIFAFLIKQFNLLKKRFSHSKFVRNKWSGIAAFAFIIFLLVFSNQVNLRKSLAKELFSLGSRYFSGQNYNLSRAEKLYRAALFVEPKLPNTHYQLARIYFVEEKFPKALDEISAELALNPDNQRSFYIKGLIDGYAGNSDKAVEDFQKFVLSSPNQWAGYNDLAWVYFGKGDWENAKKTLLGALEKFPDNAWLLNGLSVVYSKTNETELADEYSKKATAAANKLTVKDYAMAYPGNDPNDAEWNLKKFKSGIGNVFASACSASFYYSCESGFCTGRLCDPDHETCSNSCSNNGDCQECVPGAWDAANCRGCDGSSGTGVWGPRCSHWGNNNAEWCACNLICTGNSCGGGGGGPTCGANGCESGEDCNNCPQDCGNCPPPPPGTCTASCSYSLNNTDAQCYLNNPANADLPAFCAAHGIADCISFAKQHWHDYGCHEGREPCCGVCAATHYNCTVGTSTNNVEGNNWTWWCNGTSCSETIPMPLAINGTCSGSAAYFSWILPSGYTLSYFRIQDTTTGTNLPNYFMPESVPDTGSRDIDVITTPGHSYHAWVHTRLPSGGWSNQVDKYVSCPDIAGATCGNGILEPGEQCDLGDASHGNGNGACPKTCNSFCGNNTCISAVCGNGIWEPGEQCDLGVNNGSCPKTCSSSCTNNSCASNTNNNYKEVAP